MKVIRKLYEKLRSVKNIELYAALVLSLVLIVVIFVGVKQKNPDEQTVDESYIGMMEHKICSVVEKIEGCGKASVAISYASDEEKVFAYETESTSSGGVVKNSSSLVFSKGEPLVTTTLPPKIMGVVVVAEGANDPIVRYKIINVVVTLLDVSEKDVRVLTYKS